MIRVNTRWGHTPILDSRRLGVQQGRTICHMRSINLKVKVSLSLFIILTVAAILFTLVFVKHREEELQ